MVILQIGPLCQSSGVHVVPCVECITDADHTATSTPSVRCSKASRQCLPCRSFSSRFPKRVLCAHQTKPQVWSSLLP